MKGKNKILFEHQLKTYFLKKKTSNLSDKLGNIQKNNQELEELIHNIDLLLPNLQEQFSQINKNIQILEQQLNTFINRSRNQENTTTNINDVLTYEIPSKTINPHTNLINAKKIDNTVLELAISLYNDLKSWTKVSQQLAERGYLSRNNTPYTSSNLSRSISEYKVQTSHKLQENK